MKKSIIQQFAVFVCAISLLFITTSCGGEKISDESGSNTHTSKTDPARMPLNLSVYLDLSNRLTRDVVPSQSDRDKALIAYLIEKFKERCKRDKAKECANHFQVFFYPTPADPKIAELANDLDCDFGKMDVGAKNEAMNSIDEKIQHSPRPNILHNFREQILDRLRHLVILQHQQNRPYVHTPRLPQHTRHSH